MAKRKRRLGDRYDGRRLRSLDPFYQISPYIMRTRLDCQNLFDDQLDITAADAFLKAKNRSGEQNLGILHLLLAAMIRTISQKPGLNRFIAGQRIYARNEILVSLVLKKNLTEEGLETTIKVKFDPTDTIYDVAYKVGKEIAENRKAEASNDTDKTAKLFMLLPRFLLRFAVWALRTMDYYGIMPKVINRVSPFHTSVFVTDLGSIAIEPVFHHLYEFGTTSAFLAFGMKLRVKETDEAGNVVERKMMNIRINSDERIVDGYYFANAFRLFKKLVANPDRLTVPPDSVFEDVD